MDFASWNKQYTENAIKEREEVNRLFDKAVDNAFASHIADDKAEIDKKVSEYRNHLETERDRTNGVYGCIQIEGISETVKGLSDQLHGDRPTYLEGLLN